MRAMDELMSIRKEIDELDDKIVALLGVRYSVIRKAGELKARTGLDVVLEDRVAEVLNRVEKLSASHDLDGKFIRELYSQIIDHAHDIEQEIRERKSHAA